MRAPSAACVECRNLLGGYLLGALEPQEAESVRDHLAGCADCRREFEELAPVPQLLDLTDGDTELAKPPASLEEAVLDRFAREHPAHRDERQAKPRRRWGERARARFARPLPAALAGALAAAAITAVIVVLPVGQKTASAGYEARLTGSPAVPGATAYASLASFSAGTRVRLHVRNLGGNPDNVYELWCLRDDGTKVTAGTFRVDARGRADVSLTTAAILGEYHRLAIERHGQMTPAQPGQQVMAGTIRWAHS